MNNDVLKFFNANRECVYTPPKLPDGLSNIEAARWILNNKDFAWLELDIPIPTDLFELSPATNYYVSHREGNSNGWDSCCIHGIDTWTTRNWPEYVKEETVDTYKWTALSNLTPISTKFWKDFYSEKYKRVRYMRLSPGGYIAPHSDAPGSGYIPGETPDYDPLELGCPINIAIIHPENCYMVLEGFGIVPFKSGKAFLVNIRHTHAVLNFSDCDRIHMIGFCVVGNKKEQFAELIKRSYERT